MKNLPWLSLALLLAAYSTFSWFLYHSTAPWLVWTFAFVLAFGQALLLTTFSEGFRVFLGRWLESDVGYFTVVLCSAFLVAFALVWIQMVGYIVVLVASEVLARLDLQNTGFSRSQSLGVLTTVSLVGLAIGFIASRLVG
ncbi:hypothetical protein IQ268_07430 [Oculatella sp. LEGE 06141]|uniref:hypothetical protein n=1 Tax=Oculatella sp. LEGE 06141 TaxID=1828648 RepID=UPI00187EFE28|nr:hypothetical protein [Oculatella sp. LEGE 06141]MBE9178419.1 hypothetical protein [Oculatella sp. LEGE 06141]